MFRRHLFILMLLFLGFCSSPPREVMYDLPVRQYNRVTTGLENFLETETLKYRGKRLALVTNHSGVDFRLRSNIDLLRNRGLEIVLIFSPEHGLYGYKNFYEKERYSVDKKQNLIIYHLHKLNNRSLRKLLKNTDAVLFDIQDMGMRCYTYISVLKFVMDTLKGSSIELVVLDRPNPLGFLGTDGAYLNNKFYSRHISSFPATFMYDMTMGEAALYYRGELVKNVNLRVIPMKNYSRDMYYHETMLPWIPPSPNLPTYESSIAYSAIVYLEGINLSLGRGTPKPFEYIGAPWIDPMNFCNRLNGLKLKNFRFRPIYFSPTFSKYRNRKCGGVQIFYTGGKFSPTEVAYRIIQLLEKHYIDLTWDKHTRKTYDIDHLSGSDLFRKFIIKGKSWEEYAAMTREDAAQFDRLRKKYLLY